MYNLTVCCLSWLSIISVVVDWAWRGFNGFKGSLLLKTADVCSIKVKILYIGQTRNTA